MLTNALESKSWSIWLSTWGNTGNQIFKLLYFILFNLIINLVKSYAFHSLSPNDVTDVSPGPSSSGHQCTKLSQQAGKKIKDTTSSSPLWTKVVPQDRAAVGRVPLADLPVPVQHSHGGLATAPQTACDQCAQEDGWQQTYTNLLHLQAMGKHKWRDWTHFQMLGWVETGQMSGCATTSTCSLNCACCFCAKSQVMLKESVLTSHKASPSSAQLGPAHHLPFWIM